MPHAVGDFWARRPLITNAKNRVGINREVSHLQQENFIMYVHISRPRSRYIGLTIEPYPELSCHGLALALRIFLLTFPSSGSYIV